jgi:hypothetical protein
MYGLLFPSFDAWTLYTYGGDFTSKGNTMHAFEVT